MRENTKVYDYISQTFHPDNQLDYVRDRMQETGREGMSISEAEAGLLQFFIRSFQIQSIVEVGCFLGFSAIQMARALPENGKLISLESDPKYFEIAQSHIERAGLSDKIEIKLGDAKDLLKQMQEPVDMIFIDADKGAYPEYLDWAEQYVRKGGLIFGDNSLLFGHAIHAEKPTNVSEKQWRAMRSFNERLADTKKYRATLIPTQEGLTVAQKLF